MLVEGVQPCLISPMMSKCFIFVSAISSSIIGGSDWTLAESTLSVFGCQCGCGSGGCDGGGSSGDGAGSGDFGGEECFDGLFMGLLLEVGCLPHFPMRMGVTFSSRNAPVLLY